MVLEAETKIVQSKNARTQYVVIPADMVADSQYPFKANEHIRITIDPYRKMMIIRSVEEPIIEISPKGIYIKGKKIEVEKEFGIKVDHLFKYFPYLHGPYSPKIIQTTYRLAYFKLINIEEKVVGTGTDEEYVMRIYTLTNEGKGIAEKIFQKLPDDYQKALLKLKDFAQKPIRELLKYVYTKYPEVKKYTTLDEFF